MQAKPQIVRIVLVIVISSLILGACGGGNTGSTWFNLPSIPLTINENGSASVLGISLPVVLLQPAQIQQMQAAGIQQLQVRIGYNGIHAYANGNDLPYLAWSQDAMQTLQDILTRLPPSLVPNGAQIAGYLPWLRTIGLGVTINLPGAASADIARWSGETTVTPESAPDQPTIGPLALGGLAFDESGSASFAGIPLSNLESALGTSLGLNLSAINVTPNMTAKDLIDTLGGESFAITTQPNGIELAFNGRPLPSLAYDSNSLTQALNVAGAFVQDPGTLAQLQDVLPRLPGADIDLAVSFTGEPAGETNLSNLAVEISEDGSVSAFGLPVAPNAVPTDLLANLQAANVQKLDVNLADERIVIGVNGEPLPIIQINRASAGPFLQSLAPILGVSPDLITTGLDTVFDLTATAPLGINVRVPVAAGATPLEIPAGVDTTMVPPSGDMTPTIHVAATFQNNELSAVNNLTADDLSSLGLSGVALPENIGAILTQSGASQLQIKNTPNQLDVVIDGQTIIAIQHDAPSWNRAISLAGPYLAGTPLEDPAVAKLLQEQILPLLPGADLDIVLNVQ